ncbi:hypothetical protein SAMN05720354_11031 [Nitrosospira sp. Nsp1]|nr:hypothetical protein SAMN05720354_11031 [Nitrosospira sp. Nsp1]
MSYLAKGAFDFMIRRGYRTLVSLAYNECPEERENTKARLDARYQPEVERTLTPVCFVNFSGFSS